MSHPCRNALLQHISGLLQHEKWKCVVAALHPSGLYTPSSVHVQRYQDVSAMVHDMPLHEQVHQRMHGSIQQWPQHVLQEGGPQMYEGGLQVDAVVKKQEPSQEQPSWYGDVEEDEDDDIIGGPRF
jgi:hypothetical protein